MYYIWEVFKSDGKRFLRGRCPDLFTAKCWCHNDGSDLLSVLRGSAYLAITKSQKADEAPVWTFGRE